LKSFFQNTNSDIIIGEWAVSTKWTKISSGLPG
jgi:hypothetical protein